MYFSGSSGLHFIVRGEKGLQGRGRSISSLAGSWFPKLTEMVVKNF
jgi:hypothetical protein